ncbi:trypsin-like serine peptidase [Rhodalgimonas zhirmunskyi]|uniref:Trypsin-like peptidase domain-containing protein n=1 Tax=Rhodalgimonas zhirmunskyi TaxID=2964767 RepID=A0AAJ1U5P4_9RHOB|nr:trypsin-like peptidase domain-containing protein [Rhodoalgimonas zhirmunskyi]MDQ2094090.1 trypsin-like peptidase domain-containing protein [Rhodoalgimonas zhirmunskyi]
MRRGAVLALLIATALALPSVAAAQSALTRLTDRADIFGWEAVGRIDLGDGYCSGTLIAPDLVLTAAHCVYDKASGKARDPKRMVFRAGLRDGKAIASRAVAKVVAHPDYDPRAPIGLEMIRSDAALLRLEHAIPAPIAAPFHVYDGPQPKGEVSVVSFGKGRDDALSWQKSCSILGRQDGVIAFDCNVTYGSSGAPVFVRDGGRMRILSLVSSGNPSGEDHRAFGMELAPVVTMLKRKMRSLPAVGAAPKTAKVRRLTAGSTDRSTGAKFIKP